MVPESASRVLHAVYDLNDLLKLAHGAAERVEQEVYGRAFEDIDHLSRELRELRTHAERMQLEVEQFVKDEKAAEKASASAPSDAAT